MPQAIKGRHTEEALELIDGIHLWKWFSIFSVWRIEGLIDENSRSNFKKWFSDFVVWFNNPQVW